jgi:AraC family transcriptional activator of mtrCDE
MTAHMDKTFHLLLSNLQFESSLFHVGRYCGDWRASTAGRAKASFHILLQGDCRLHFCAGGPSVSLHAGEALFLLRDVPHYLSPHSTALPAGKPFSQRRQMEPPGDEPSSSVGIACGFFEFASSITKLVISLLPDYIVLRRDDPALAGARAIFDLLRAETGGGEDAHSPLITRLTDLLFFYAVRQAAQHNTVAPGLALPVRRTEFSALVSAIGDSPGSPWTTSTMARFVHMSRATFCRRFAEVCNQAPAQFVTLIRMKLAAELLREGVPIARVADHVGYHSESAFAHAFKRTLGMQPGAYRRTQTDAYAVIGTLDDIDRS